MQALHLFKAYRYEIVAFLTGAAVMVLEVVGARLIAPQFGMSTYVWTAMIGVILGALAVGYAIGGRLADQYHSPAFLGRLLIMAAALVLIMGLLQQAVLESIAGFNLDLRLSALLAALVLFGLPSLLIGMVSPHLAKIRVTSLEATGKSIGKLEAAGALGSIAGTFACGYFLLGVFGSRSIIIGIVVLLVLTSFVVDPFFWRKARLYGLAVTLLASLVVSANPPQVLADVDSSYARYRVLDSYYGGTPAHLLVTDRKGIQSAAPTDGTNKLLFGYSQRFEAAVKAHGTDGRVLVVGGGTHTIPSHLIRNYPDMRVDVAEIDPTLEKLARQYFYLQDSPRLTIHHQDGRAYLNRTTHTYDLICMDAFSSMSPPFQLATRETVQRIQDRLRPDGVAVVNVIASYEGGQGEYLRAIKATYENVFDHVSVHQVYPQVDPDIRQNLILFASNDAGRFAAASRTAGAPLPFPAGPSLVLTDDYAPIEQLTF